MKKNTIILIAIIVLIVIINILLAQTNTTDIPTNYIVVFRGESGEITHTTYLYEKKKKGKKKTYKYINTISTSRGYDSVNWQEEVLKKGKLKKKKDIYKQAEKNNADVYVKYVKDNRTYTYKEFKKIWK